MKQNKKRPVSRFMGLLLAVLLIATMLPMPIFAESGVEQVTQELEALNQSLTGDKFVIISEGSSVTVRKDGNPSNRVQLGNQVVQLTIPVGVTVKWGAKIEGNGNGYLIELSEQSKGTLELLPDVELSNSHGEGIHVQGGVLSIKENVDIDITSSKERATVICAEKNGKVEMEQGTITAVIKNGSGIVLRDGGQMTMSGGKVVAGQVSAGNDSYGIHVLNGSTLTLKNERASIESAHSQGAACKVEGGCLNLEKGAIYASDTATVLEVSESGKATIAGGTVRSQRGKGLVLKNNSVTNISGGEICSESEDVVSLSDSSVINISGGMIRAVQSGKKAISASGSSANIYISGGSIRDIEGLTPDRLKNRENGEPVYRVTLTGLPQNGSTSELTGPVNYGFKDVTVDDLGKVYFYVPAGKTDFKMKVNGTPYAGRIVVKENHNNELLMQANYEIPGEIIISKQPEEQTVTYGEEVTLDVQAQSDNGKSIKYQWYSATDGSGNGSQILDGEINATVSVHNIDAGEKYYYCVLKAENCTQVRTEVVKITVNKANYSGETVGTAYVKSGQETNDAAYILPTLPAGMSWGAITVEGTTPPLIKGGSDQPSIIGNNRLSFKTSSQPANTSAEIKIPILGGTNYNDSNFTLTVKAVAKTPVQISGLNPKNEVYNGQAHQGYSGTPSAGAYTGAFEYRYLGKPGTVYPESQNPPTKAGYYTVKVSVPDSDPTYMGELMIDFVIERRPVTVKADDQNMTVGTSLPPFNYTVTGQLQNEAALNGAPVLNCAADGTQAGMFDIVVNMAGVTYTENYKAGNPASQNGTLTVRPASSPAPRPRYNLSVDPEGEWDFGKALRNAPVHGKEFVVKNTGNRTLRQLSVTLSGEQAEHFELTKKELEALSVHQKQSFMVTPKSGLPVGEYRATLRIHGDHGIDKQVALRFKVAGSLLDGHRVWEKKTEVPLDKEWTIRFNRPFDKKYVTKDNVFLCAAEDPQVKISATIRLSEDATKIHIQPEVPLQSKGRYFLVIQTLKGENGRLLKENIVMPFETK